MQIRYLQQKKTVAKPTVPPNNSIVLIVGLGNPGVEYENTRHNAGAWLVNQLAAQHAQTLRVENKFFGLVGSINFTEHKCHLLLPTTFMNNSGQAVAALAKFYKIPMESTLVIHDELDIPTGQARLQFGRGQAGHNGLRDIIKQLGTKNFYRLRIGISRPQHSTDISSYVLKRPSVSERCAIDNIIHQTLSIMPDIITGRIEQAMQTLHTAQKTKVTNTFLDDR